MESLDHLHERIKRIEGLVVRGEEHFEKRKHEIVDSYLERLKPKKFKNDFDKLLYSGMTKVYKGYKISDVLDLLNKHLNDSKELKHILNLVRDGRRAVTQLTKEYNDALEIESDKRKIYLEPELRPMKLEAEPGSSMTNYPWERTIK